ncbi:O-methyltransferase, family 3 [Alteracholeplasma palmae J233]|uniref:O-methyltransferase, family 3 n=1 Tax=Alteracholeplasma palmae (strain ATCC 49389 / J233) TaxID=1318466 RepID=U4KRL4_ALTPJ|nr:O-methyltransferase [Alteracholeplasma palmae]CCV64271.1 O-methyltransferase, family 3 [Alteracholeplasma palmae J233]
MKNKIQVLQEMKSYAETNDVPIICDEGLSFLLKTIKENNVKSILEIGTAIGYSALLMSEPDIKVDTIERDLKRYQEASQFLKPLDYPIHLIYADALLYDGPLNQYDLIFIDAAKAQYEKFFNKYQHYLKPNGIIVCDNLNFHNLTPEMVSRNTRQLLRKINGFKDFLTENSLYETTFYNVGDGMSISRRKEGQQ